MRKFETDESSQIKEIHFNDETNHMIVFFTNGSSYLYEKVRLFQFNNIITANSIGAEFALFAKTAINYRRLR